MRESWGEWLRHLWRQPEIRHWLVAGVLCALSALVVALVAGLGLLESPENSLQDAIVRRGADAHADPRLLYLAIDTETKSISQLDLDTLFSKIPRDSQDYRALELIAAGWPWSREVHAMVLDKLFAAGATAVGIDLLLGNPRTGDDLLKAALERHSGKVVLVGNFAPTTASQGDDNILFDPPIAELLSDRPGVGALTGFANFFTKADGVVRHAKFLTSEREQNRLQPLPDEPWMRSFSAQLASIAGEGGRVPKDSQPRRIHFAGGPMEGFRPVSMLQLFVPDYWRDNLRSGAVFRGKIVVVGAFGNWAQDQLTTPYRVPMPGPEVHLNALNGLLQGNFVAEAPAWWPPFSFVLAAVSAMLMRLARPAFRLLPIIGVAGLLLAAAWVAYPGLSLPIMPPLAMLLLGGGAGLAYDFAVERAERARTRRTLERYVSRDVVHQILDDPSEFQESVGGVWRPITILFSDVRDFTSLTEDANAQSLVSQLNEYFAAMVQCVFRNNGSLDKFIGDAVMAVWGNTSSTQGPQRDACNALRCALEMREELARLNVKWSAEGRPQLFIGIGLNQGEAIVGNLGSPQKMEFTAIGDAVNLASRMEGLTKPYGVDLLVTQNVARLVEHEFLLQDADLVKVKGKKKAVEIFAVLGRLTPGFVEEEMQNGLRSYCDGLTAFRAGEIEKAWELMVDATERRPQDPLAAHYRARLEKVRAGDASASWSGATVMKAK